MRIVLVVFVVLGASMLHIQCLSAPGGDADEHQPATTSFPKPKLLIGASMPELGAEMPMVPSRTTMPMVVVPGGSFTMGSTVYPEEHPPHLVTVDEFKIDIHEVTNDMFQEFVTETGYITVAERPLLPADYPGVPEEDLISGSLVFTPPTSHAKVDLRDYHNWWRYEKAVNWRTPEGTDSNILGKGDYPVVHVAFEDALKFCRWKKKKLPTEAQYEWAARGGLSDNSLFAWGDEETPNGKYLANYWQGEFPSENLELDRFRGIAPVASFPPNPYGAYDLIGNVWEWTHEEKELNKKDGSCCSPRNPISKKASESYDPNTPGIKIPRRVLKGGSYLCGKNYCFRYRPAARSPQMMDSATNHIGFRCVSDATHPKEDL